MTTIQESRSRRKENYKAKKASKQAMGGNKRGASTFDGFMAFMYKPEEETDPDLERILSYNGLQKALSPDAAHVCLASSSLAMVCFLELWDRCGGAGVSAYDLLVSQAGAPTVRIPPPRPQAPEPQPESSLNPTAIRTVPSIMTTPRETVIGSPMAIPNGHQGSWDKSLDSHPDSYLGPYGDSFEEYDPIRLRNPSWTPSES